MPTEWDLDPYDDDPWDEWYSSPGAQDLMRFGAQCHMIGNHNTIKETPEMDRTWAEEDEPRYLAALLAAGAEPDDAYHHEHGEWQQRAANVLMQKYHRHWWWSWSERVDGDPKYRQRAQTCRRDVQLDELRKFYTWLCNQRREPWTQSLVPSTRTGLLLPY